jgi:N-formylglutamate deformylase
MSTHPFTTDEAPFRFRRGTRPLLVSMPHVGTYLPAALAQRMTDEARRVPDTDWHLELLYDFLDELGASVLVATHSRYVIDLNRPPDGASLYPGRNVTGLCPIDTFDEAPLYVDGVPDDAEIAERREAVWVPYHRQLEAELARLREHHGTVALWDAHSIRAVVPRFFAGRLPDLNLGTGGGASCDPALAHTLEAIARDVPDYTSVLDGTFKGGYITRHYGAPRDGVHAVQLEMTQASYMDEAWPFDFLPERAALVRPHVRRLVEAALDHVERRGS